MFNTRTSTNDYANMFIMIQELNKFEETTLDPNWHNKKHETTKFTQREC